MRNCRVLLVIVGVLASLAVVPHASADGNYTLQFIPTLNLPDAMITSTGGVSSWARGTMSIKVVNGKTNVHFSVRGASPDTLYTMWTVFNVLSLVPNAATPGTVTLSQTRSGNEFSLGSSAPPQSSGFPREGNAVAPTARTDSGFTSGMGPDPGLNFYTNSNGDAEAEIILNYELITTDPATGQLVANAPVGNSDVIVQCVPVPGLSKEVTSYGRVTYTCADSASLPVKITTTWLRKFIGQMPGPMSTAVCANYDATDSNTQYWQCIDPATMNPGTGIGLPRVHMAGWNHFRLANHPDALTHGYIGGNIGIDHKIDMVGRLCDVAPAVGPACPPMAQ